MSGPAGTRTTPYVESICNTDPNVFFCEDFEDEATYPRIISDGGLWNNPAFAGQWKSFYNEGPGRVTPTLPTAALPTAGNHSYRLTIIGSPGGDPQQPGASNGVEGCFARASGGNACTGLATPGTRRNDYYVRWQMYVSSDATFPVPGYVSDIKTLFTQPDANPDNPSADFQNGANFLNDYNCRINAVATSFGDVLIMRRSSSQPDPGTTYWYPGAPLRNNMYNGPPAGPGPGTDYCVPLSPGAPANNANAVRFLKNRWYTIELHFVLGQNGNGTAEMWIDGNLAYSFSPGTGSGIPTCTTCSLGMGYFFFSGYKRGPGGGYLEYDNIVMSTRYIGPPRASTPSSTPSPPQGFLLSMLPVGVAAVAVVVSRRHYRLRRGA